MLLLNTIGLLTESFLLTFTYSNISFKRHSPIKTNVIGTELVIEPENLADREPDLNRKKKKQKKHTQIKYSYFKEKTDIFMCMHMNPNHLYTNMQNFSFT